MFIQSLGQHSWFTASCEVDLRGKSITFSCSQRENCLLLILQHFASFTLMWSCRLMVWKCIVGVQCCCAVLFLLLLLEGQLLSFLYPGSFQATLWGNPCTAPRSEPHLCLCVRNLSSAGEEARSQLRCCEGLVDSLLHILKACVNTSDYDSKVLQRPSLLPSHFTQFTPSRRVAPNEPNAAANSPPAAQCDEVL